MRFLVKFGRSINSGDQHHFIELDDLKKRLIHQLKSITNTRGAAPPDPISQIRFSLRLIKIKRKA